MSSIGNVRNATGLIVLTGHILCGALLIVFWLAGGYTFDEMVNVFALILPMFAAYLSLVVNFAFRPARPGKTVPLSYLATVFSIVLPLTFVLLLVLAISLKAFNIGLYRMEDMVKFIGIVEAAMGGYTATVVKNLFSVNASQR